MTRRLPAVAIMAKEPVRGGVKTRLHPAVGAERAADLYRAFLADKIDQVTAVAGAVPYLAYAGSRAAFEELCGDRPERRRIALVPQRGDDLGARLLGVTEDLCDRHDGVLLVDSDTPNLPSAVFTEAIAALDAADVVVGPAWDGGYYLIGTRRPEPCLFEEVEWSTPRVLRQTLRNAARLGLAVHLLTSWYDVDTPADLGRLGRDLADASPVLPGYPRRTAATVGGLGLLVPSARRDERWKTVASRRVYQNRWTRLDEAVVELPDGHLTLYGVVTCPECVGVVPLLSDGGVLLVRQFRYVAQRETWEIPTGGVGEGESLEGAAQRELAEECGYAAGRLTHLQTFHTSKSVMDEVAHVYAGLDLYQNVTERDATEAIEVRRFEAAEAMRMVERGEITDSMSVIGLLVAATRGVAP